MPPSTNASYRHHHQGEPDGGKGWHARLWRRLPRPVRWACRVLMWFLPIPQQVGHLSKYRRQSTGTTVPLLEICLLGFGLLVLLTR